MIGLTNVSTTIVGNELGVSTHNIRELCTSDKINKWAKYKPINYNKISGLTEAERKGTVADNASGIYYGIKGATKAGNLTELHNTDYTYYRPTGTAESPYRIGDFRGYDQIAKPTLSASDIPAKIFYNQTEAITVTIDYDYNNLNKTGINISEFVSDAGDVNAIGDYYPCVIVDNYIHALYNKSLSSGAKTYTTLRNNGVWYKLFVADVDLSALQTTTTRKVTFFLMKEISRPGFDDYKNWVDVTGKVNTDNAFTMPNGINLSIPFESSTLVFKLKNIGVEDKKPKILINWQYLNSIAPKGTKFRIEVAANDIKKTIDWVSEGLTVGLAEFTRSDFDLSFIIQDQAVQFAINVKQYKPNSTTLYDEICGSAYVTTTLKR